MLKTLKPRLGTAPTRIKPNAVRERMRGNAWMSLRARVLRANPLCVHCKAAGWLTAATECDHITPLHQGGTDDESNLQGLCHDCHAAKTAAEGRAAAGRA